MPYSLSARLDITVEPPGARLKLDTITSAMTSTPTTLHRCRARPWSCGPSRKRRKLRRSPAEFSIFLWTKSASPTEVTLRLRRKSVQSPFPGGRP